MIQFFEYLSYFTPPLLLGVLAMNTVFKRESFASFGLYILFSIFNYGLNFAMYKLLVSHDNNELSDQLKEACRNYMFSGLNSPSVNANILGFVVFTSMYMLFSMLLNGSLYIMALICIVFLAINNVYHYGIRLKCVSNYVVPITVSSISAIIFGGLVFSLNKEHLLFSESTQNKNICNRKGNRFKCVAYKPK